MYLLHLSVLFNVNFIWKHMFIYNYINTSLYRVGISTCSLSWCIFVKGNPTYFRTLFYCSKNLTIIHTYVHTNRFKIGWKLSKLWLFRKYMNHYQHTYWWAAYCGKMAASGDVRLRWPAPRTRHGTIDIYINYTTEGKNRVSKILESVLQRELQCYRY